MNWLVAQCREFGDRLQTMSSENMQMQNAIQQNGKIVNDFVEQQELVRDWQAHLAQLQKESEDAVQEQEAESLDVQEQAEDGE